MLKSLKTKLAAIQQDVSTNLIPGNIKKDVTILNVTGTYEGSGGGPITQEEYDIDEELARSILQDFTPYTELEYIESTGTQYINTGYKPNQNTKIDMVMESIDWGTYKNPFGVRTATNSGGSWVYTNRFALWLYGSKENILQIGYDGRFPLTTDKAYTNTKFHLIVDNGTMKIKDLTNDYAEETLTFTSVGNFTTDYSLLLGAMAHSEATILNLCNFKLYSCKIYEGNTLIKDYIPAKNRTNDMIGLYDKVGESFLYNPRRRRICSRRCCKCLIRSLILILIQFKVIKKQI